MAVSGTGSDYSYGVLQSDENFTDYGTDACYADPGTVDATGTNGWDAFTDSVGNAVSDIGNGFGNFAGSVVNGVGSVFTNVLNGLANGIVNGTGAPVRPTLAQIQQALAGVPVSQLSTLQGQRAIANLCGGNQVLAAQLLQQIAQQQGVTGLNFGNTSTNLATLTGEYGSTSTMTGGGFGLGNADNSTDEAGLRAFMAGKGMTQQQINNYFTSTDPTVIAKRQAMQAQLKDALQTIFDQMLTSLMENFKTTSMAIARNV
jgi:hypothetical protein